MERLTKRDVDGATYIPPENMKIAVDKLSLYEDFEEEGRLLRLPCKIGDPIFYINVSSCGRGIGECVFPDLNCTECKLAHRIIENINFDLSRLDKETGKLEAGFFANIEEAKAELNNTYLKGREKYNEPTQ